MRLHHTCARQCLLLRAVGREQKFLLNENMGKFLLYFAETHFSYAIWKNENEEGILDKMSNSLNFTAATNQLLNSSNGQSTRPAPSAPHSDSASKNDLLNSLTQALLSTCKKSQYWGENHQIDLTRELSQDSVKERGEKYPPPANCKYLTPSLVNEEIWDLLPRKNRSVDLAFQHVQEPIINGLSSLSIPAHWLFKDIQSVKTVNAHKS